MTANLYFLQFNNYFNRRIIKFDSIEEYQPYVIDVLQNVNLWNPNDGMMTEQVVNWDNPTNPNYVIAETSDGFTRWFIIEAERTRSGQYKMQLRRDIVADYKDSIVNAPMYIEKATVQAIDDPAIYNKESMEFNQIKQSETLLKDETGIPWVVGYIPRDSFQDETTVTASFPLSERVDETLTNLSDFKYYNYNSIANPFKGTYRSLQYNIILGTGGTNYTSVNFNSNCQLTNQQVEIEGMTSIGLQLGVSPNSNYRNEIVNGYKGVISDMNAASYQYTGASTESESQEFLSWNGKIIHESSTNKYWKVIINPTILTSGSIEKIPVASSLFNYMNNNLTRNFSDGGIIAGTADANSFQILYTCNNYIVSFEEQLINASVTIGSRANLNDSPYDMFCIPYGELQIYNKGVPGIITNGSIATAIATAIGAQSGSANIYDIQLLPYCPLREAIKEDGTFDIADKSFDEIKDGDKTISYLFWCYKSDFTFNIPVTIDGGNTVLNRKLINETQMCRLCSPNYNGVFEFNPAKNNGVSYVNVDCTYKPYSPYIHINPDFKGLYGSDFNDARGLILGGDFSLPQVSNAWANYQLQNKNYQAQFDRQIENLEVQQSVARIQDQVGILTGSLSGATGGAIAGSVGGPVGAIAGAVVGGIGSLAGGIADYSLNEKLRQEQLDYAKDMFGYQIGNIKALPSSLAKTTALNANNKLFPFIEFYDCTDVEKQALIDKLTWNGMSVYRIDKLITFLNNEEQYVKGRIIRLDINDDYHAVNEIKNELQLGVYITA